MWAELLDLLAAKIRADLTGVVVTAYADAVIPDVPTVRVLRASAPARPLFAQMAGTEFFAVECWVRHEDPETANRALADLEERVLTALRAIPRIDPITTVTLAGVDPDGDLFRPNLGSRINLNISWRKPRQSYHP